MNPSFLRAALRRRYKMRRLGGPLYRTMQLDLKRPAQLLGDEEISPIFRQHHIAAVLCITVLSQLNGMPPIGLLKAWEPYIKS